jgi:hypothetical protein
MTTRKKIVYGAVFLFVFVFLPYLYGNMMVTLRYKATGSKQIYDISMLQSALELYSDANKKYPLIGVCAPVVSLEQFLKGYAPYLHYQEDSSPLRLWEKVFYPRPQFYSRVGTSEDGTSFVLLTHLSRMDESVLQSDLDGQIFGCDCDDPNYCVSNDLGRQ